MALSVLSHLLWHIATVFAERLPWVCEDPTAATSPGLAPAACQDIGKMLPCMGIQLSWHSALTCSGLPW